MGLVAGDPIVFERVPASMSDGRCGAAGCGVQRHGKHFWFELDRRPWLGVHFGMAGGLHTPRRPRKLGLTGRRAGAGWPPRFTKLRLTFDDGGELVIADGRRLGRIRSDRTRGTSHRSAARLRRAPRVAPPARFAALLAGRGAPIKALLLDQSFAAGVGNWIADEVLYQARIAPGRRRDRCPGEAGARIRLRSRRGRARGQGRRRQRPLSQDVALSSSLGSERPRGHRAGREDPSRHDRQRTTAWIPAIQR